VGLLRRLHSAPGGAPRFDQYVPRFRCDAFPSVGVLLVFLLPTHCLSVPLRPSVRRSPPEGAHAVCRFGARSSRDSRLHFPPSPCVSSRCLVIFSSDPRPPATAVLPMSNESWVLTVSSIPDIFFFPHSCTPPSEANRCVRSSDFPPSLLPQRLLPPIATTEGSPLKAHKGTDEVSVFQVARPIRHTHTAAEGAMLECFLHTRPTPPSPLPPHSLCRSLSSLRCFRWSLLCGNIFRRVAIDPSECSLVPCDCLLLSPILEGRAIGSPCPRHGDRPSFGGPFPSPPCFPSCHCFGSIPSLPPSLVCGPAPLPSPLT